MFRYNLQCQQNNAILDVIGYILSLSSGEVYEFQIPKMAASTAVIHGLPVLGLRRPKHEVDHVHFALCNDVILGLARESSKGFICYRLMSELTQRNFRGKWAVLLTDDNKGDYLCFNAVFIEINTIQMLDNEERRMRLSGW